MKTQIFLASPKGFCAGVERAINTVERAINTVENIQKTGHGDIHDNIYVYHEIVHNSYIIENFKKQGIKFINHLSELPDNAKSIVFSAHGVSREIMKAAEKKNLRIIDATCPLVD
ncbi:MAG: 4-hydroxy-3-methylbut-2-enyl diphosphate reductase, partial [Bifidobacteriaceae bacterium]|nr:4-hydroxy-3-methylbut-2-enyl diphosphate reductase [Bifidobacteriaceae bacterium]